MRFFDPPHYRREELKRDAIAAIADFREERLHDEKRWSSYYSEAFDDAVLSVGHVLEVTDNLSDLASQMEQLLTEGYLPTLRYLCRPTVSDDDFSNLSGVTTRARSTIGLVENAKRAEGFLRRNLNTNLFPWLSNNNTPSASDILAAKRSVAALMAEQQTKTAMRGKSSKIQEQTVRETIVQCCGFKTIPSRNFNLSREAPAPGEMFKREATVAGTKADVVLGLWDGRFMALECKVSNTPVNSFKRLNHEVVEKVTKWTNAFGRNGVVAGAVLQGCFKVSDLEKAQDDGAAIFWSRDLEPLVNFINATHS